MDHIGNAVANQIFATVNLPVASVWASANASAPLGTVGISRDWNIGHIDQQPGDGLANAVAELTEITLHFNFPGALTSQTVSGHQHQLHRAWLDDREQHRRSFQRLSRAQLRIGGTIFNEIWTAEASNSYVPTVTTGVLLPVGNRTVSQATP